MLRLQTAFTLLELLVVISVIALLLALLLPAIGRARESALSTMCSNHQRNLGLGITMYADDHDGQMPPIETGLDEYAPIALHVTKYLRVPGQQQLRADWSGLGLLFTGDYVSLPEAFYCPSVVSEPYLAYEEIQVEGRDLESHYLMRSSYNYRNGRYPSIKTPLLAQFAASGHAMTFDNLCFLTVEGSEAGLRSNHTDGMNAMFGDGSVSWFHDPLVDESFWDRFQANIYLVNKVDR